MHSLLPAPLGANDCLRVLCITCQLNDGPGLRWLLENEPFQGAISSADKPDLGSRALSPIASIISLRHPHLQRDMQERPTVVSALAPSEPTDNMPIHVAATHGYCEELRIMLNVGAASCACPTRTVRLQCMILNCRCMHWSLIVCVARSHG